MLKRKLNQFRILIALLVLIIGVVLVLFILSDFRHIQSESIAVYNENQNVLADIMLKNAADQILSDDNDMIKRMKTEIEENYPTTSSNYCIFAKNDEIVFLKDENTTSTLVDEKLSSYFTENNVSIKDMQQYIVSRSNVNNYNERYSLVICTKQTYLIKKLLFEEFRLHYLGYFIIYGSLLLIIIVLSFYKIYSKEKTIKSMDNEMKKNRLVIEKLETEKSKFYVDSEKEDAFYSKKIVSEVIQCMSEDERSCCFQIDILIKNLKMEHFVLVTAILGRIKVGNSIACYWKDNQFKVLLFHSDKKEVQEFADLFIHKYRSESEEKVEELVIKVSRLSGGSHEI